MSEGNSPTADASAAPAAGTAAAAASIPVNVRGHASHHAESTGQPLKEKNSCERLPLPPRPTFMEHLADSRDAQFHLKRQDSSELDRYFVRLDLNMLRAE